MLTSKSSGISVVFLCTCMTSLTRVMTAISSVWAVWSRQASGLWMIFSLSLLQSTQSRVMSPLSKLSPFPELFVCPELHSRVWCSSGTTNSVNHRVHWTYFMLIVIVCWPFMLNPAALNDASVWAAYSSREEQLESIFSQRQSLLGLRESWSLPEAFGGSLQSLQCRGEPSGPNKG